MSEQTNGASRRDLLRGGAIGVGALVGAMALTSAEETSAEAAGTSSSHTYYVNISGINPNTRIKLSSLSFGGENVAGSPTPTADGLTLAMPTGQFSPKILQAFANKSPIAKVTIRGYQPDASGKLVNSLVITLTGAQVVYYHLGASSGVPTDTVHITYATIDLDWALQNVHFTWNVPA